MDPLRKTGLVLAALATALWAVVVVGVVTTGPAEGVNIGAALLAVLAVPLAMAASVVLLVSHLRARRGRAPDRRPAGSVAAVLGAVSVVLMPLPLVLGPRDDVVPPDLLLGLWVAAVTAFVLSALLFLTASPRPGRSPDRAGVQR